MQKSTDTRLRCSYHAPTDSDRYKHIDLYRLGNRVQMLWTIFVVLVVLWLLGLVTSYTMSGFIHILLVLAIAVVLIRVIQGRRPIA